MEIGNVHIYLLPLMMTVVMKVIMWWLHDNDVNKYEEMEMMKITIVIRYMKC